MKKHILILIISMLGFLFINSAFVLPNFIKKDTGTVGDVKYSILNEDQFKMVNGPGWVLLDGDKLSTESDLYKLLSETGQLKVVPNNMLPNADGMFIRGVDTNENDNFGDSEKGRVVGDFQADLLKEHNHNIDRAGLAQKNYSRTPRGTDSTGDELNLHNYAFMRNDGGLETRPRNITLFTYIKINNL